MKKIHKIMAGIAIPFALVGGAAFDYQYSINKLRTTAQKASTGNIALKQKYDREVVPALLAMTLNRCGDVDAKMHGLLAAKFIFDSNENDEVRAFLKSKKADPHHYGAHELPGGDGLMNLENAHKLAAYLMKENIAITAEPDRHNGDRQLEYLNNGTGGGRLVIYYHPAPSDYDGKNKTWIPPHYKKIPADGIYVPTSPALVNFLMNLMDGKYTDVAMYRVMKTPEDGWEIKIKKLVMDGPAAPVQTQKPKP